MQRYATRPLLSDPPKLSISWDNESKALQQNVTSNILWRMLLSTMVMTKSFTTVSVVFEQDHFRNGSRLYAQACMHAWTPEFCHDYEYDKIYSNKCCLHLRPPEVYNICTIHFNVYARFAWGPIGDMHAVNMSVKIVLAYVLLYILLWVRYRVLLMCHWKEELSFTLIRRIRISISEPKWPLQRWSRFRPRMADGIFELVGNQ